MPQLSHSELDNKTKLLRATFLTNLAFFQKRMPELYEFYKDYQATTVKLTIDHNNEVNLVSNGNLVYAQHPKQSSEQQVEAYFKQPQQFVNVIDFKDNKFIFEHAKQLHSLYERRQRIVDRGEPTNLLANGEQIDLMTMIGIGLGYQCEELIGRLNIRYFYIWEPDKDVFYCAMHTINFSLIYDHCANLFGGLTVKVGGNENQFVNEIDQLLRKRGRFNMARLFMYRHYKSEVNDKGFDNLTALCYRLSSGWGFCEDEIISISHTLTALNKQLPILKAPRLFVNDIEDTPVFIIGNGPSLDEHLDYIRNNQNNAVILSCGTALKAILDAGIVPDFHIEMERVAATYEWIDQVGHKEKLKQISIIALNTVYSEIYNLFGSAFIIPKPRDGGMDFLYEYLPVEDYPGVYACNPTVTNAASAISIRLGFKRLYLYGVDFGYKDETKHHAKGSMYYQKDFHGFTEKMESAFAVKGNFCEEVFTTQMFDMARGSMEILFQTYPDVVCCNCSDGAYIQLTIPQKIEEIGALAPIASKKTQLERLMSESFSTKFYSDINFSQCFERKLKTIKQIFSELSTSCKTDISDRPQLARLFTEQYEYVCEFHNKRETELYYRLFIGTLNYFQTNIMTNVYYFNDKDSRKKYIEWALSVFEMHLNWLYEEIKNQYNKPSKL